MSLCTEVMHSQASAQGPDSCDPEYVMGGHFGTQGPKVGFSQLIVPIIAKRVRGKQLRN